MLEIIKTFGSSMWPFLQDGDVVFLKRVSFSSLKVDDFVCVKKRKNLYFTHRVIYISPDKKYLITKGDANPVADSKVSPRDILGKVIKIKRGGEEFDPYSLCLFQSTFYYQEIKNVTKKFNEKKLDFVILKGLPVHLFYEKTHPRRIYVDCDILIKKTDFSKVKTTLWKLGFKVETDQLSTLHKRLKNKIVEISFYKFVNNYKVVFDVHLEAAFLMTQLGSLNNLYPDSLIGKFSNDLLSEKEQVLINSDYFPILSRENLVVYLSLHLFHHNFRGYNRFLLLHNLLKRQKIDFKKVEEIIENYKFKNFVYPVFLLLKKYYSPPIDKLFLKKIKPEKSKINFINSKILTENIFDDEIRVSAGTKRFKNIYSLSPSNSFYKFLSFLNPQVFYSLFWVILKRLSGRFRYYFSFQKFLGKFS